VEKYLCHVLFWRYKTPFPMELVILTFFCITIHNYKYLYFTIHSLYNIINSSILYIYIYDTITNNGLDVRFFFFTDKKHNRCKKVDYVQKGLGHTEHDTFNNCKSNHYKKYYVQQHARLYCF